MSEENKLNAYDTEVHSQMRKYQAAR